ncbi:hypothetical protein ABZ829_22455 [Streptomyces xanthochromogenes]
MLPELCRIVGGLLRTHQPGELTIEVAPVDLLDDTVADVLAPTV